MLFFCFCGKQFLPIPDKVFFMVWLLTKLFHTLRAQENLFQSFVDLERLSLPFLYVKAEAK